MFHASSQAAEMQKACEFYCVPAVAGCGPKRIRREVCGPTAGWVGCGLRVAGGGRDAVHMGNWMG